ncbi:sugar kinase [Ammoniphilus sp. YIM 78166]|uniref:sugar kinase n=1 Tax=Ammoniphilus sp. YIM 78166 TaxID=1644106 RepID=UPI00106F4B96|nr:sugar kinase [Ammoniphilus sp. YIM 78166]
MEVEELDVVTLGESMALFIPLSPSPLRYAEQFKKTIGGAESNVAIGLSRLGHQAGWMSRLGADEFGLYVRNVIRGEGVDTSRVKFDPHRPTAVFFKDRSQTEPQIYYYRKHSAASSMNSEDLDEPYIAQAKILHITGITPALSDSCLRTVQEAIRIARNYGLLITFDPNIRLKLWSSEVARQVLVPLAATADIVMPGAEEAELLTGERQPEKMAQFFLERGSEAVVIKLGEKGAFFATRSQEGFIPAYRVEKIVDTVGAGDGFAAGFLSGLLRGWSYEESVRLANRVGAYALTVEGDMEGLPYWSQVSPDAEKNVILR